MQTVEQMRNEILNSSFENRFIDAKKEIELEYKNLLIFQKESRKLFEMSINEERKEFSTIKNADKFPKEICYHKRKSTIINKSRNIKRKLF